MKNSGKFQKNESKNKTITYNKDFDKVFDEKTKEMLNQYTEEIYNDFKEILPTEEVEWSMNKGEGKYYINPEKNYNYNKTENIIKKAQEENILVKTDEPFKQFVASKIGDEMQKELAQFNDISNAKEWTDSFMNKVVKEFETSNQIVDEKVMSQTGLSSYSNMFNETFAMYVCDKNSNNKLVKIFGEMLEKEREKLK